MAESSNASVPLCADSNSSSSKRNDDNKKHNSDNGAKDDSLTKGGTETPATSPFSFPVNSEGKRIQSASSNALPPVLLMVGMAGSGKTTLMQVRRGEEQAEEKGEKTRRKTKEKGGREKTRGRRWNVCV